MILYNNMFCCFRSHKYKHYSFDCEFCLKHHCMIKKNYYIYIAKYSRRGSIIKITPCNYYYEDLKICIECSKILNIPIV